MPKRSAISFQPSATSNQPSAVSDQRKIMKDFRKLQVWEKAHCLARKVYAATIAFPHEELYGLTSQIRRASVSVPTNLAEGCGRNSDGELARFSEIAMGSAAELEYLLLLASDLKLLDQSVYRDLEGKTVGVKRMLASLIQKLKADRWPLKASP